MIVLAQAHRVVPSPVIVHSRYPQRRTVCSCSPFPSTSYFSKLSASRPCGGRKANASCYANRECNEEQKQVSEEEEEEDYQVLTAVRSKYNDIVIVDTPKSRVLLLDSTHNVHSIINKDSKWTDSYWDDFAALPPIVPEGPIAMLGLGGGTAAHLMLDLWPSLQLEGWEIDEILIDKAREYLGLSALEKHTEAGGVLKVHIGDALSPSGNISGAYAGHVDMFFPFVADSMMQRAPLVVKPYVISFSG
ncbi:hypothetical protein HS088_TW21G01416 [Tripterygium wilfordii]|uniref:S-adenosyl-L-methionine-dependent methyltransferases superfamily protein n=1 Tax=Tripterygium wilfordii TaxID=458696 RepID=A0A7J7C5N5_TRIWF|nr:hypothetical protein HS088_TW21G01416 [Tripterygium wilfordii]